MGPVTPTDLLSTSGLGSAHPINAPHGAHEQNLCTTRAGASEWHLAVDGVILDALGLGLEGSDFLLVPEQKDAFALVGGCGLADPHLGFCRESHLSLRARPCPAPPFQP